MKPLHELTLEDLARSPVWRCTGSPDSEASVERTELSALSEASPEIFVVRTSFTLSDGSSVAGYCSPTDDSGLDYVQPVIITESGHAPLSTSRHHYLPSLIPFVESSADHPTRYSQFAIAPRFP